MTTKNENAIHELFGNQQFAERFSKLSTPDDMKELMAEYGVKLSDEELAEMINKAAEAEGELNAEELDAVSGGIFATLGAILAGTWSFAVQVYGSPENAVKEIGIYWARKLGYKG